MSGFVGILNFDDAPVDRSFLESLTAYLSYCGPDRHDIWIDGRVGFGHALLRTTFESAEERQPFSLDGQVWLTADARIDDRAELIRKLKTKARTVKLDAPDPDLILQAYEVWGEECVQHLIGDFAFAVWDTRRQRLFCARDQFGVIPFYYAKVKGGLIFSNVLNCLRLHPSVSDQLNEQAIGDFLLFNMNMSTTTTTFIDIKCLPPAHTLTWDDGTVRIHRYWDLPETGDYVRFKKPEEHVERFRKLLEEAVGDRLRTDTAGVHLSGGMDSTSIAVTAVKLFKERGCTFDLRAYTIVYEWLIKEDEGRYADEVAGLIGIPIEHLVAEEFLTQTAVHNAITSEPFPILTQTAEHEISRRVSEFSRVLLVGFGGDPLFSYRFSPFDPSVASTRWSVLMRELWLTLFVYHRLPRWGLRTALRKRLSKSSALPALPDYFNTDFARRVNLLDRRQQIMTEQASTTDHRRMLLPYWVNLFTWAHPGTSRRPLKVLFPFFDVRLASYVAQTLPFPWRRNKFLLREAMAGLLPESVRHRPKTPLYVQKPEATNDPWEQIAQRMETGGWRQTLMKSEEVARYVDVQRAVALIDSTTPCKDRRSLSSCVLLASWLFYQRQPELIIKEEGLVMAQTRDEFAQFTQSSLETTEQTSKKTYHAPTLHDYGHVRDVTQSNATGPILDGGGGYPNVYTS